jgi:hypothetical protein
MKESTEFILRNCSLFSPIRETVSIHVFLYQVFWPFLVFRWKIQSIFQEVRWPSLSHLLHIAVSTTPNPVQTSFHSGRVHLIQSFVLVSLHCTIMLCYFMPLKRERERERERYWSVNNDSFMENIKIFLCVLKTMKFLSTDIWRFYSR